MLPFELPTGPVAAVLAKDDRSENSDDSRMGVRGRLLVKGKERGSEEEMREGSV